MNEEIKQIIISALHLEDVKTSDIDDAAPLFGGEGLGLDSIDALELALALSKRYDIRLDSKTANLPEIFYSVNNLAEFIQGELNAKN